MSESLIDCRDDDKEFLVQCLQSFRAETGHIDFNGTADYILNGLLGYSNTIEGEE